MIADTILFELARERYIAPEALAKVSPTRQDHRIEDTLLALKLYRLKPGCRWSELPKLLSQFPGMTAPTVDRILGSVAAMFRFVGQKNLGDHFGDMYEMFEGFYLIHGEDGKDAARAAIAPTWLKKIILNSRWIKKQQVQTELVAAVPQQEGELR